MRRLILRAGLILLVASTLLQLSLPALAQEPSWNIVIETPRAAFTSSELETLLNDAYLWLVDNGMQPAPPCDGDDYLVLVTEETGLLEGLTYTQTYYRPNTLLVTNACVEWIKMGLYNDPEGGFTREELGDIYVNEARMTIVHELFHAVQPSWRKYVYLDDEIAKASGWITESSATAIEYFYVGFLDAFVVTKDGSYTFESRLAETIKNYFSAALWTRDPFKVSLESYDEHYERLYDYSPLFIWVFSEKGIESAKAFFEERDPRNSVTIKQLVAEFLHQLPQGFVYSTANKTIVMYPSLHILNEQQATLTLDTNSAIYLAPRLPTGRYVVIVGDPSIEVSVTYQHEEQTIVNPDEIIVRNDTVITLVNTGDKPATIQLTLDRTGDYREGEPIATITLTETQTQTQITTETITLTTTKLKTTTETKTLVNTKTITTTVTHTTTHTQTLEKVRTITLEKPVTLTTIKTVTQVLEPPPTTLTTTAVKTVTTTLVSTYTGERPGEPVDQQSALLYSLLGLLGGLAIALLIKRG